MKALTFLNVNDATRVAKKLSLENANQVYVVEWTGEIFDKKRACEVNQYHEDSENDIEKFFINGKEVRKVQKRRRRRTHA